MSMFRTGFVFIMCPILTLIIACKRHLNDTIVCDMMAFRNPIVYWSLSKFFLVFEVFCAHNDPTHPKWMLNRIQIWCFIWSFLNIDILLLLNVCVTCAVCSHALSCWNIMLGILTKEQWMYYSTECVVLQWISVQSSLDLLHLVHCAKLRGGKERYWTTAVC
jgi:hypothetical protein